MSKKLTPLEKFVRLLNELSRVELGSLEVILSAIRGPDNEALSKVKYLTTGRIRAFLGENYYHHSHGIVNNLEITKVEMGERTKILIDAFEGGNRHFVNHFLGAVCNIAAQTGYNLWSERKLTKDEHKKLLESRVNNKMYEQHAILNIPEGLIN